MTAIIHHPVSIRLDGRTVLNGDLYIPAGAQGLVIFAHGSGSSRHSPRNRFVAEVLHKTGLATLLFDLLTPVEEEADLLRGHIRFNIQLLGERLTRVVDWAVEDEETRTLKLGLFGASTGAAACILTARQRPDRIRAIVSRGGRPDMAGLEARSLDCPTLLIVGGEDDVVIELNREAFNQIPIGLDKDLQIIPGASHLFEEPSTLEQVARLAADWFSRYLRG